MPSQYSAVAASHPLDGAPQASVTLTSPNLAGLAAIDVPRPKMSKVETPALPDSSRARAAFIAAARDDPATAAPAATTAGARPRLGGSQTIMCWAPAALSSVTMVAMLAT